jgi:NAD(P)H-hydrate repair Nnr-like enzyme with NAD(P)H-hydrate dehydratase domain
VLAGPGIGNPQAACALLEALVPRLSTRLVVDALGTAYLTAHHDGIRHLAGRALLTPNATELAEVLRVDEDEVGDDVLGATRRAAALTGVTVLSGAEASYVVEPSGDAWCVEVGSPGTAVAGSGDVKAGAVAGLLARGADPAQAAAWGAYLHGRGGERLTASVGRVGFLAREVAGQLPHGLAEIEG